LKAPSVTAGRKDRKTMAVVESSTSLKFPVSQPFSSALDVIGGDISGKLILKDVSDGCQEDQSIVDTGLHGEVPREDVDIIGCSSGLVNVPISQELLGPGQEGSSKFPDSIGGIGHDGIFAATVQSFK
jgi:hypothetical protein